MEPTRPNTKNHLETLALRRWQDLLCVVAVARRIAADDLAAALGRDRVEVGLVVGLVLAATVRLLGSQSKAEVSLGVICERSRSGREGKRSDGCGAHGFV